MVYRAKYQKNVEAYHNKMSSMKPNIVPNCIRSESYMITFEVEEEKYVIIITKVTLYTLVFFTSLVSEPYSILPILCTYISRFPIFGKKYQLKFANDPSAETQCLVHFPSFIRFIFISVLQYLVTKQQKLIIGHCQCWRQVHRIIEGFPHVDVLITNAYPFLFSRARTGIIVLV